jgi:tetratricopeptide (TPR) repeat protein
VTPLLLLILLTLAVLALLAVNPSLRERAGGALRDLRRPRRPQAPTGPQTLLHQGEEIPVALAARRPGRVPALLGHGRAQLGWLLERRRRWAVLLVALLIGVVAIWNLPFLTSSQANRFLVLIAPFRGPDGQADQGGRAVAEQLAALLPDVTRGRVAARVLDQPPAADLSDTPELLRRNGADALLWGDLASGGMLDQPSLRPLLVYQPNGTLAPAGWIGYQGRFAMPLVYLLASGPVNGKAVLPDLLGALADYGAGGYDSAFTTLGALTDNYPVLQPALPYALRGNILWARGEYEAAAGEYRRTGVLDPADGRSPQLALLANNLGVILQDASAQAAVEGDSAARDDLARQSAAAFDQAESLLNGQTLGQIELNRGLEALGAGRTVEATKLLEGARAKMEPSTTLLLGLARAYRGIGRFDLAEQTLNDAGQQIELDANRAPQGQGELLTRQLSSAVNQERGLLTAARALGARDPLIWELERLRPPARGSGALVNQITAARDALDRALTESADLSRRWARRSASEDAAGHPAAAMVATGQARRAETQQREQQRWLAALNAEMALLEPPARSSVLGDLWNSLTGDRTPLGQSRAALQAMVGLQPQDVDARMLLGRAYWLGGQADAAGQQFDAAAQTAPGRPEPVYGQGVIELGRDPAKGQQLLLRAIELNGGFFPARERLAEQAEGAGDWPLALEQRRWLAKNTPSDAATLALGRTLRLSGKAGYPEAEKLLLPLGNANNVDALLELGRLYTENRDPEAARVVLERASQEAPDNADVRYLLGQTYVALGRNDAAQAQFQQAVRADRGYVQAHLALAKLYRTEGSAAAAQSYEAALDAGVNDLPTLKEIGPALLAAGAYDSAADAYGRAIRLDGRDPELYYGLALANFRRGDPTAAQTAAQQALNLRETFPEAQVLLGDIALQRGDRAEALRRYNSAAQQNPALGSAYLGLGKLAAADGNWAVAQGHFTSAAAHDQGSAEAQLWLGEARIRLNNIAGAIDAYQRAIERNGAYPEAYFGLAQAQLAAGKLGDAQANLARALQLRPRYAEARLLLGKLYEQQGDLAEATEAYGQAIIANGNLAEPYYRRSLLYLRTDRIAEAQADLERAVQVQPDFPEAHYWLGRTYLINGRPAQANDELTKAIAQRSNSYPEASFYQGLAQEQLGNREAAIASLKTALEQGRGSAWINDAQDALARLSGDLNPKR